MNTSAIIVAAFPALLIVGVLLAPLFARRDRSRRYAQGRQSRPDYVVNSRIGDQGAVVGRTESRLASEGGADDPPAKGDQYFDDWAALQARFNDELA